MATALGVPQLAPSCTEQELVAAVRGGDDRAFEQLYARYRARIGAYILGMVRDHARAEDLAQDVFISALRRLRDTERPIAFKPWLYEIAENACIDEFRRTRRTREVPLDGDQDDVEGSSEPVLSCSETLDSAVENRQRLSDLRGAFHGLSASHHRIIVMREFDGLSDGQIGEQLGMSKPVVESTLFRARRKLSEEYDELVSGRRCERVQAAIEADGERPLGSLGLRDRRQLARHLGHCQHCRRHARMAGVDESFFKTPSIIGKIAALFPIPAWLRLRRSRRGSDGSAGGGIHSVATLPPVQMAARFADPSAPSYGLGRATATAAAIVLAGAGGGLVSGLGANSQLPALRPSHARVAPPAATGSTSGTHTARRGSSSGAIRRSGGLSGGAPGSGAAGASPASAPGIPPAVGAGTTSPSASNAGTAGSTVSRVAGGAKTLLGGKGIGGLHLPASTGAGQSVSKISTGAGQSVSKISTGAGQSVSKITTGAGQTVSKVTTGAGRTVSSVTSGATNAVSSTVSGVGQTASSVTSGATKAVSSTVSGVGQTASSVTSGATNAVSSTVSNLSQTASNAVNSASKPQVPSPRALIPGLGGQGPSH